MEIASNLHEIPCTGRRDDGDEECCHDLLEVAGMEHAGAAINRTKKQALHMARLQEEGGEGGGGEEAGRARPVGEGMGGLSKAQRQRVVKNALATQEQDNERLLRCIKQRMDRVGMELPKVEVRFQELSINADVYVGNRALPTIANFFRNWFETLLALLRVLPTKKRDFSILDNISGVIKPGR